MITAVPITKRSTCNTVAFNVLVELLEGAGRASEVDFWKQKFRNCKSAVSKNAASGMGDFPFLANILTDGPEELIRYFLINYLFANFGLKYPGPEFVELKPRDYGSVIRAMKAITDSRDGGAASVQLAQVHEIQLQTMSRINAILGFIERNDPLNTLPINEIEDMEDLSIKLFRTEQRILFGVNQIQSYFDRNPSLNARLESPSNPSGANVSISAEELMIQDLFQMTDTIYTNEELINPVADDYDSNNQITPPVTTSTIGNPAVTNRPAVGAADIQFKKFKFQK